MATTLPRTPRRKKPRKVSKPKAARLSDPELLEYAAKHRPPQSWYDSTDDPTVPVAPKPK